MRRPPATTVYYGLELVLSMPSYVFVAVLLVRDLHLSPLQLVLMGTVMEAAVFVSEVPTGILADAYSRRASIVVSLLVQGIAIAIVGVAPTAGVAIAAWALWGFGYTFMSGAYEAWITDEVGVAKVGPVFLRGTRLSYAGALVGLGAQVAIALYSLRAAVVAAGAVTVLAGMVSAAVMPETGFRRRPREERGSALRELSGAAVTSGRYIRAQPLLLLLLGITFFAGMSSEAFDRLWEAHFIRDVGLPAVGSLDSVVWFGLFGAAALVAGLVASTYLIRRFDRAASPTLVRTLVVLTALLAVAQIVFGLAGGLALAVGAFVVIRLARSLAYPLYMTWLNQQITDSSVRATVISIAGQADAIGQAGGGPILGGLGNALGIRAALVAGGLVLAPALALFGRALRHGGSEPVLEELPQPAAV
ncbi:MAG: MFS transporter [Actinobacteria bacterium]|nr:MAG: MFS transporter [Actinomycetota bacterium]